MSISPSTATAKKTLLLTGGSQGIGYATVKYFLERDWRVAFVARDPGRLAQAVHDLVALGFPPEDVHGEVCDVGDLDAVVKLAQLPFLAGRVDALVLNAFYQKIKPAQELTRDELESHWRINNLSPILLMQACFPSLKAAGGSIAYISSIMDRRLQNGYAAYGASKAYMNCFIQHAALDFGPHKVRINAVVPGATGTEALKRAVMHDSTALDDLYSQIPWENRLGDPAEVAEAVWFAITGPRYFHGREIRVDGGIY